MTYKDQGTYEGDFFENQRHGKGKRVYQNGDFYLGSWEHDQVKTDIPFFMCIEVTVFG